MVLRTDQQQRQRSNVLTDSKQWNAARCHRLLRQLESRLTALKELTAEASFGGQDPRYRAKRPAEKLHDVTNRPPKRIRYTYKGTKPLGASRTNAPLREASLSSTRALASLKGSSASPDSRKQCFPTPIASRGRARTVSATYTTLQKDHSKSMNSNAIPETLVEDLRCLRSVVSDGHFRQYAAIFDWLANLLRITKPQKSDTHPKSLFGMCLRKVPACVDDIVAWDQSVSGDATQFRQNTSDTTLQIYGELEGFVSRNGGWPGLKIAIRSHGAMLLKKAIRERLFDCRYVDVLVRLCLWFGYVEEATALAVAVPGPFPPPRNAKSSLGESSQLQPLHSLILEVGRRNGDLGHVFACVSSLIKEGQLPPTWLLTEGFSTVLEVGLEALKAEYASVMITTFFGRALQALVHLQEDQDIGLMHVHQRLIGIIAGIAATARAINHKPEETWTGRRARSSWRKLISILDDCTNDTSARHPKERRERFFMVTVGRHLAVMRNYTADTTSGEGLGQSVHDRELLLVTKAADGEARHGLRQHLILLACSVARGCSLMRVCAGHDSLTSICQSLESPQWPGWLSDGLLAETAFLLAQRTKDSRDLAFAENQIQKHLSSENQRGGTRDITSISMNGWRWEEGICEWVLPMPGARARNKSIKGAVVSTNIREGWSRVQTPTEPSELERAELGPDDWDDSSGGAVEDVSVAETGLDAEYVGRLASPMSRCEPRSHGRRRSGGGCPRAPGQRDMLKPYQDRPAAQTKDGTTENPATDSAAAWSATWAATTRKPATTTTLVQFPFTRLASPKKSVLLSTFRKEYAGGTLQHMKRRSYSGRIDTGPEQPQEFPTLARTRRSSDGGGGGRGVDGGVRGTGGGIQEPNQSGSGAGSLVASNINGPGTGSAAVTDRGTDRDSDTGTGPAARPSGMMRKNSGRSRGRGATNNRLGPRGNARLLIVRGVAGFGRSGGGLGSQPSLRADDDWSG